MNIFGLVGLSFLISLLVLCVFGLVACFKEHIAAVLLKIGVLLTIVTFIIGIFIGISAGTNSEKIYIEKYKIQKSTIEESLQSGTLSGFERMELINKTVEINGELAERKARIKYWYRVVYDKSIYDQVEPIVIK